MPGGKCVWVVPMTAVEQVRERIGELADSAWMLAAVATLMQRPEAVLAEEHGAVLGQAGLARRTEDGNWSPSTDLPHCWPIQPRRGP